MPELRDRVQIRMTSHGLEMYMVQSYKSGAYGDDRQAENHEHQVGTDDDPDLSHQLSECAVVTQKCCYPLLHYSSSHSELSVLRMQ